MYKGYLPVYFKGYGIFGIPYTSLLYAYWVRLSKDAQVRDS